MHTESILAGIATIVVLAIGSEWVAWRLRSPSILVLLTVGIVVGPVTRIINPDQLLGPVLLPMVSLGVGIILFEGGLSLKLEDLRAYGRVVWLLISVGVMITWVLTTCFAHTLLRFDLRLSILTGAILVVTGPTVVTPLIAHIRLRGQVGPILRWEGITIDPVGASLAVLTFEALYVTGLPAAPGIFAFGVLKTAIIGLSVGGLCAALLVVLLHRHLVPDALQSPVAVALVVGAFGLSNGLEQDSGLLSVTVMGVALANQRVVDLYYVATFKENLRVLVLSTVFIILSARLDLSALKTVGIGGVAFLVALLAIVRPATALVATFRSGLTRRERGFIAYMAPRGVVAAAVSSVFALRLRNETGVAQADEMVAVVFLVIIVTVVLYALTARHVARALNLTQPDRTGVLMAGAHRFARGLAEALKPEHVDCVLVDRNRWNVSAARLAGNNAFYGDILAPRTHQELDLAPINVFLGLTANDEVNALAALHFSDELGRDSVYQLPQSRRPNGGAEDAAAPARLRGRTLFAAPFNFSRLDELMSAGANFKVTKLSEKFTYSAFHDQYGESAVVLGLITARDIFVPKTDTGTWAPVAGQRIVALVSDTAGPVDANI